MREFQSTIGILSIDNRQISFSIHGNDMLQIMYFNYCIKMSWKYVLPTLNVMLSVSYVNASFFPQKLHRKLPCAC